MNGANVGMENHKQVLRLFLFLCIMIKSVQFPVTDANLIMDLFERFSLKVVSRIRASGEACVLLVADKDCDTWHRLFGQLLFHFTLSSDDFQFG